jgi:hypothetical protein
MFNDLQILPISPSLLARRRATSTTILRNLSPSAEHGLPITVITISGDGRRVLKMVALLQLRHQFICNLVFSLAYGSKNPQSSIDV